MERLFKLQQHGTTLAKELSAGFISYITVVYIIIVNATILAAAGIPFEAGIIATILTSFFGCLIIGFWSNTPILLIPGMGLNAMFTYTIVQSGGFSWQEALAMVFVTGLIFVVIAFTPHSEDDNNLDSKFLKGSHNHWNRNLIDINWV